MSYASPLDNIVSVLDNSLRVVFAKPKAKRPSPSRDNDTADINSISENDKRKSISLMRVNHVGEVCAQALYQGQALTSRDQNLRDTMKHAADEELDHLNWCATRINELDGNTSLFNPLWYAGSFALGVGAGLAGDKWSLGFLAETEHQVVSHLNSHLDRLPEDDLRSRQIVEQMIIDEQAHAEMAENQGSAELPVWIKSAMRQTAKIMTSISERI